MELIKRASIIIDSCSVEGSICYECVVNDSPVL